MISVMTGQYRAASEGSTIKFTAIFGKYFVMSWGAAVQLDFIYFKVQLKTKSDMYENIKANIGRKKKFSPHPQ